MSGFASGRHAWGECQRCGLRFPYLSLRDDGSIAGLRVCSTCYEPRHPLDEPPRVGADRQALYRPSPEQSAPLGEGVSAPSFAYGMATGYIGYYPGMQNATETSLRDRSGMGNAATFGAELSLAEAWATTERFSTPEDVTGTTNSGANLPTFGWAPATESLLVFAKATITAPSSTRPLFGTSNTTPNLGFGLKVTSTGKLRLDLHQSGADVTIGTSAATLADGTENSFAFVFDAVARTVALYVEGVVDTNFSPAIDVTAYDGTWYPFTCQCVIGGTGHTSSQALTMAQASRYWHIAKRTGALPSNIATMVSRMHYAPNQLLMAGDW